MDKKILGVVIGGTKIQLGIVQNSKVIKEIKIPTLSSGSKDDVIKELGKHLGNAINFILYILSPEAIFFGGSVSKSFQFFEASMLQPIKDFLFKGVTDQLIIELSKMGNISILGAAALIIADSQEQNSKNQKSIIS